MNRETIYQITIAILLFGLLYLWVQKQSNSSENKFLKNEAISLSVDSLQQLKNQYQSLLLGEKYFTERNYVKADSIFAALKDSSFEEIKQQVQWLQNQQQEEPKSIQVFVSTPSSSEEKEEKSTPDFPNKENHPKENLYQMLQLVSSKGVPFQYVGMVKDGKANGYGVAIYDSGSIYKGEWKDNLKHGYGVYTWKDGESYDGFYVENKREGLGTYRWKNGEYYQGNWENDMRHGEGVIYKKNGKIKVQGTFEKDVLKK
jgi:hypothetical protein